MNKTKLEIPNALDKAKYALDVHEKATQILKALVEIEQHRQVAAHDMKAMRFDNSTEAQRLIVNKAYNNLNGKKKEAEKNYHKYCAHALQVFN